MPPAVARPFVLTDPGFLWLAPVAVTAPTNTVAGGVFTDTVPASFVPLGATTDGTNWSYSTTVEPIRVAEFFDPIKYATTDRGGSIGFNLANWTLSNYQRALNGGIAALVPTSGTGDTALYTLEPPDPGEEVRAAVLWESTDSTVRLFIRQSLQGGEIASAFQKAPTVAAIPCTFNMEVPETGKPFTIWGAGDRGGV